METTEWIAAGLGLVNVALVVRRSVWNYAFAIAMVTLSFFVFWDSRLYSDALLQIFFLVINVYGWFHWLRLRRMEGAIVPTLLTPRQRLAWGVGTLAAALLWGYGMAVYTDAAAPVPDALIAGGSVAAQILQARRRVECWVLWIAVDLIAIPLYFTRSLEAFAILYAVFLVMSVVGLISWAKACRRREAVAA